MKDQSAAAATSRFRYRGYDAPRLCRQLLSANPPAVEGSSGTEGRISVSYDHTALPAKAEPTPGKTKKA